MKKTRKGKRRERCGHCRKLSETARLREDPFMKEVWNEKVMRVFCDECYQEALWAI